MVEDNIVKLFFENSTVPSSTKNFFLFSLIFIIPGLKKVIVEM